MTFYLSNIIKWTGRFCQFVWLFIKNIYYSIKLFRGLSETSSRSKIFCPQCAIVKISETTECLPYDSHAQLSIMLGTSDSCSMSLLSHSASIFYWRLSDLSSRSKIIWPQCAIVRNDWMSALRFTRTAELNICHVTSCTKICATLIIRFSETTIPRSLLLV